MVYEFRCTICDVVLEFPTNVPDEHCGMLPKRVWGLAGISFKGSGFYSKDNR